MTEIVYGTKYEATKDLSRAEIAKLIRADIKAAIARGLLPRAKYSVTCKGYAGGQSIDVRIARVEKEGFVLFNPGRLRWDLENPHAGLCGCPSDFLSLHSPEACALLKTVYDIVGAYNFDGSDLDTDYFHVRFYSHVSFEWQWEREVKALEIAALEARLEREKRPTLAAPPPPANDVTTAQVDWLASIGAL